MDDRLDFEEEDKLLYPPRPATKRKKVIGLDDLLADYYAEKSKSSERQSKKPTVSKGYNSDDEDDKTQKSKEKMLSKLVDECQKQVHEMNTEDHIPLWGLRIFGHQHPPPSLDFPKIVNCNLLQPLKQEPLKSILDIKFEEGERFLEGLLVNGWLSKLVIAGGYVEDSIASWTFRKMLYSSKGELQEAACDFWCRILLSKTELSINVGWFPSYSDLSNALQTYGYLSLPSNNLTMQELAETDVGSEGPPLNIGSWVRALSACCQIRSVHPMFSTSEAEELLGVIICLFLDRHLQGLSYCLHECLQSVIDFFMENEWNASCKTVARSIAQRYTLQLDRTPKDANCLRVIECISGVDDRSKHLKSQLGFHILLVTFDEKVADGKEILELLLSMNVKVKDCDFSRLYIYLVLVENWLLYDHWMEDRDLLTQMWCKFLRKCSSQITSTDWRSYASKVRNKASYILQNNVQKGYSE